MMLLIQSLLPTWQRLQERRLRPWLVCLKNLRRNAKLMRPPLINAGEIPTLRRCQKTGLFLKWKLHLHEGAGLWLVRRSEL